MEILGASLSRLKEERDELRASHEHAAASLARERSQAQRSAAALAAAQHDLHEQSSALADMKARLHMMEAAVHELQQENARLRTSRREDRESRLRIGSPDRRTATTGVVIKGFAGGTGSTIRETKEETQVLSAHGQASGYLPLLEDAYMDAAMARQEIQEVTNKWQLAEGELRSAQADVHALLGQLRALRTRAMLSKITDANERARQRTLHHAWQKLALHATEAHHEADAAQRSTLHLEQMRRQRESILATAALALARVRVRQQGVGVLRAWHQQTRLGRQRGIIAALMTEHRDRVGVAHAFSAWQRAASRQRTMKRAIVRLLSGLKQAGLRDAMVRWRSRVAAYQTADAAALHAQVAMDAQKIERLSHQRETLSGVAQTWCDRLHAKKAFGLWQRHVHQVQQMESAAKLLAQKRDMDARRAVLRSMRLAAFRSRALQHATGRLHASTTKKAIAIWRRWARAKIDAAEAQRARLARLTLLRTAQSIVARSLGATHAANIRVVFRAWQQHTRETRAAQATLARVTKQLQQRLLASALARWHATSAQISATQRAWQSVLIAKQMRRDTVLRRELLRHWHARVARRRRIKSVAGLAAERLHQTSLVGRLRCWQSFARARRGARVVALAVARRTARICLAVLHTGVLKRQSLARSAASRALQLEARRNEQRAWLKSWHVAALQRTRRRRALAGLETIAARRRKASALGVWRQHAAPVVLLRDFQRLRIATVQATMRRVISRMRTSHVQRALVTWQHEAHQRTKRVAVLQRLGQHIINVQRRRVLVTWRLNAERAHHAFTQATLSNQLEALRVETEMQHQKLQQHGALRAALHVWQLFAGQRRAQHRANSRRAQDFVRKLTRNAQRMLLAGWRARAHQRQMARTVVRRMLAKSTKFSLHAAFHEWRRAATHARLASTAVEMELMRSERTTITLSASAAEHGVHALKATLRRVADTTAFRFVAARAWRGLRQLALAARQERQLAVTARKGSDRIMQGRLRRAIGLWHLFARGRQRMQAAAKVLLARFRQKMLVAALHRMSDRDTNSQLASAFRLWRVAANGDAALAHAQASAVEAIGLQRSILRQLSSARALPELLGMVHTAVHDCIPEARAALWILDPAASSAWTLLDPTSAPPASAIVSSGAVRVHARRDTRSLTTILLSPPRTAHTDRESSRPGVEIGSTSLSGMMMSPGAMTAGSLSGTVRRMPVSTAARMQGPRLRTLPSDEEDSLSLRSATEDARPWVDTDVESMRVSLPLTSSLVAACARGVLGGGEQKLHEPTANTLPEGALLAENVLTHPDYDPAGDVAVHALVRERFGPPDQRIAAACVPCVARASKRALAAMLSNATTAEVVAASGVDDAVTVSTTTPVAVLQVARAQAGDHKEAAWTAVELRLVAFVADAVGAAIDRMAAASLARSQTRRAMHALEGARAQIKQVRNEVKEVQGVAAGLAEELSAARAAQMSAKHQADQARHDAEQAERRAEDAIARRDAELTACKAKADQLPSLQAAAEAAAAHALQLQQALQLRDTELQDARHAAAALELALEETGRDDARDAALVAAQQTITMREAEAAELRRQLDAARRDSSLLAAARIVL